MKKIVISITIISILLIGGLIITSLSNTENKNSNKVDIIKEYEALESTTKEKEELAEEENKEEEKKEETKVVANTEVTTKKTTKKTTTKKVVEVKTKPEVIQPVSATPEENTEKVFKEVQTVSADVTMFVGKVTHYGPDCSGCGGTTAAGYNVRNTIYYNDSQYGQVRIVAAPPQMPMYSIVKLHNYKGGTMTAIVLDRGGAIKGTKFDILVSSEREASKWGIQGNVEFEILRWGK